MKPFNLAEYLENPSRKVVTRDGRTVKIYCTDYIDKCGLFVIAKIEGNVYSCSFRKDGRFDDYKETDNDLFFAPEKHEGWINVYRDFDGMLYCGNVFATKEDAKCKAKIAIATVKIEWEE